MTKQKSTKRALLMSGLALLMCVSMLIGSTFAWFTDSVTSTGNIIKSGKLDVTMEWKDATANGAQQTYIDASTGAIFNYELWEPGYVEAKNIKISNVGNLALKYALNIIANGEVSILANVIDVYYAEQEMTLANRDMSGLTKVGTLADVLKGMPANTSGELLKGESDTVTIALKMQESAGNEYQDLAIGSDFSIQLIATQATVESDSFDNQYDKNAGWTGGISQPEQDENGVWQISAPEELAWFTQYINGTLPAGVSSRAMFIGKDAALVADVDLNNLPWTPIGNASNGYTGTFDGQGHTIYNLNVSGTVNVGLFGYALGGGNVKNLTVKNATVKANDYAGAIIGRGYTDIVNCHAENVNVTVTPYLTKGIYDGGAKAGAVIGQLLEGSGNTVVDCTAKNVVIKGYRDLGGVLGMAGSNNSVSGCSAENVTIHYVDVDGAYDSNTPNQNAGAIVGRINDSAKVDFTSEANEAFKLIVESIVKTDAELKDALAAGNDVVLAADIDLTEGVTVLAGADVTLDLNGKNITMESAEAVSMITNKGSLTINGTGKIAYTFNGTPSGAKAANTIENRGVLVVNGGEISNTGNGNQIGYAIDNQNGATLTVNDGKITATGSSYYDGIRLMCGSNDTTVTVNGGEISSIWAQNPSANKEREVKGTVVINGGTVNTTYYENYTTVKVAEGVTATVTPYGAGSNNTTSAVVDGYTVYSFVH